MNRYPTVLSVSEAREELSRALARFRREGASAAPVVLGSHRKPEAVVIPFAAYVGLAGDGGRRPFAAAGGSALAEVLGPLSPEISDEELYARTVARQRRRRPKA